MREKKVLSKVESDWLVKLSYSFQDKQYLYLAMVIKKNKIKLV